MRRQVHGLTREDLDYCPIWEFAIDEEETEGQDEATVRPRRDLAAYDPAHSSVGQAVVKAQFVSSTGATYFGYCTPATDDDISATQPVIVTANGQVLFYYGVLKPSEVQLATNYERLDATGANLFPMRYVSLVPAPGRITSGVISAFVYRTIDSPDLIALT